MTRAEKIERYRQVRMAARQHSSAALKFVSTGTLLDYARRLGIAEGNCFVVDNMNDMAFVFDLALYTAKDGRSRGIERYARSVKLPPDGDAYLTLRAALAARFTLWRVDGRHDLAGLNIWDIGNDRALWLIDEGLEVSARVGDVFAGRLVSVEDLVMTTGAPVPLDEFAFAELCESIPYLSAPSKAGLIEHPRFALHAFRLALRYGTAGRIEFRDPDELPMASQAA